MHPFPALTAAALLIEAAAGYPGPLFHAIRHPVVWIGALIGALDRRLRRTRPAGVAALVLVLLAAGLPAMAIQAMLRGTAEFVVLAILASTAFAQRSLAQHVEAVVAGMRLGLPHARAAVAHIVGRDPDSLDEAAVARADPHSARS